jgi:hypothetical protein
MPKPEKGMTRRKRQQKNGSAMADEQAARLSNRPAAGTWFLRKRRSNGTSKRSGFA